MTSEFGERFAGVCCVYDDERWLPFMLESVYSEVGKLYFLVGDAPWNGEQTSNAATLGIISGFPDPDRKIEIIRGGWGSETEQRAVGLELCRQAGFEYCFVVDADEIYDPKVLRTMMGAALTKPQVGCFYMTCLTYWKTHRFRIDPPEHYKPPVFLRTDLGHFVERRHATAQYVGVIPPNLGVCHHMSYARTDEELQKKLRSFSHAHEIRPGWYEQVWLAWDKNPGMENIHPVYPGAYKRAIPVAVEQLPPVLRRLG
jgi:hypothetical protein